MMLERYTPWLRSPRRRILWNKIKTPRDFLALILSTFLGSGLMPFAPGTFGTLAALPLAYSVRGFPDFFRALFWLALFLGGTWAAQNFDELCETQDNQNIVIDEVIGLGITAWTASDHWQTWMAAFLAFRLFDVLKPPPIRQIDRWSHRKGSVASSPLHSGYWTRYAGGFGVMVDDLIAGVEALIVILVLQKLGILP